MPDCTSQANKCLPSSFHFAQFPLTTSHWMIHNLLKLNVSKMVLSFPTKHAHLPVFPFLETYNHFHLTVHIIHLRVILK